MNTTQNEEWRDVPDYEGRYQVSDQGRVRSLAFEQMGGHGLRRTAERILAQQTINSGYQIVHLHLDNKRSAKTVHRLVAQAFCPGARDDLDVNHIDGNKQHNSASNLEWLVRTATHDHAVRLGLNPSAVRVRGTPVAGGPPRDFDSQAQAGLQLAGSRQAGRKISNCIHGKQKTSMGYTWVAICA